MPSSTPEAAADDLRQAWEREYDRVHAYTTSYRDELDRGVQFLLAYLRALGTTVEGPILECACGRGRNALPLARRGFRIIGLDHAANALEQFAEGRDGEGLQDRALPVRHDLREPLPVGDGAVGAVLDVTAVDNLTEPEARRRYAAEVARVLRPGGWALVVTFDRDDGYYAPFLESSTRGDRGVADDPHNPGISNQLFRARELDALFCPPLCVAAGNRFDFIDEAARERWTRRFHLRLYRKPV